MSNTIQLSNPLDDMSLGIGFDPILCSSNHSCDPNSVVVFNQPKLVLRAIKPIKQGEEIFMKYVDVTNPVSSVHSSNFPATSGVESFLFRLSTSSHENSAHSFP